jgi:hypothetical protein
MKEFKIGIVLGAGLTYAVCTHPAESKDLANSAGSAISSAAAPIGSALTDGAKSAGKAASKKLGEASK